MCHAQVGQVSTNTFANCRPDGDSKITSSRSPQPAQQTTTLNTWLDAESRIQWLGESSKDHWSSSPPHLATWSLTRITSTGFCPTQAAWAKFQDLMSWKDSAPSLDLSPTLLDLSRTVSDHLPLWVDTQPATLPDYQLGSIAIDSLETEILLKYWLLSKGLFQALPSDVTPKLLGSTICLVESTPPS